MLDLRRGWLKLAAVLAVLPGLAGAGGGVTPPIPIEDEGGAPASTGSAAAGADPVPVGPPQTSPARRIDCERRRVWVAAAGAAGPDGAVAQRVSEAEETARLRALSRLAEIVDGLDFEGVLSRGAGAVRGAVVEEVSAPRTFADGSLVVTVTLAAPFTALAMDEAEIDRLCPGRGSLVEEDS